jgi:hypothetical protein
MVPTNAVSVKTIVFGRQDSSLMRQEEGGGLGRWMGTLMTEDLELL